MILKVLKTFNGKAEGKTLSQGDVIASNDVDRINALVGRGFCEIVSLTDPETAEEASDNEAPAKEPEKSTKGKK